MGSYILGGKFTGHDTNAALVDFEGRIVACVEQERLDRVKHSTNFPEEAISAVLKMAGAGPEEVKIVAAPFCHDLFIDRIDHMKGYFSANKSFDTEHEARLTSYERRQALTYLLPLLFLRRLFPSARLLDVRHHLGHAAAAYYCSPFEEAAVLTIDAAGEIETSLIAHGRDGRVTSLEALDFPHTLGFVYEFFSQWLGLGRLEGPGKTMGLASYGRPRFYDLLRERVVHLDEEAGTFEVDSRFVSDAPPPILNTGYLTELLGRDGRMEDTEHFDQFQADVAASVQKVTEDVLIALAGRAQRLTGSRRLCLSGGFALNCAANGRLFDEGVFDELFIHPASNDGGCGIGSALYAYHQMVAEGNGRRHTFSPYLGPTYDDAEVRSAIESAGLTANRLDDVASWTAARLAEGKLVAWARGGSEVGPRALGNRSIFADPRYARRRDELNARVKHREWWRPFAPVALAERAREFFDLDVESPYMLLVCRVKGDGLPAITHVDGTARLQTIRRDQNPVLYDMIAAFERLTDVPVVLNTSFNIRGEPLIDSPEQALNCLFRGGLDAVVIGDYVVTRDDLDPERHRAETIIDHSAGRGFETFRDEALGRLEAAARDSGDVIEGTGVWSRLVALTRLLAGGGVDGFSPGEDDFESTCSDGRVLGLPVVSR